MHAKKRNNRIYFYRTTYVQKGVVGELRGYSTHDFVGSLPIDASEIPESLAKKLSPTELSFVISRCMQKGMRNAR